MLMATNQLVVDCVVGGSADVQTAGHARVLGALHDGVVEVALGQVAAAHHLLHLHHGRGVALPLSLRELMRRLHVDGHAGPSQINPRVAWEIERV